MNWLAVLLAYRLGRGRRPAPPPRSPGTATDTVIASIATGLLMGLVSLPAWLSGTYVLAVPITLGGLIGVTIGLCSAAGERRR